MVQNKSFMVRWHTTNDLVQANLKLSVGQAKDKWNKKTKSSNAVPGRGDM